MLTIKDLLDATRVPCSYAHIVKRIATKPTNTSNQTQQPLITKLSPRICTAIPARAVTPTITLLVPLVAMTPKTATFTTASMTTDERHKFWHCVMSIGRRVRACTRLSEPAKALTTRDCVRGISGPSTLLNNYYGYGNYDKFDPMNAKYPESRYTADHSTYDGSAASYASERMRNNDGSLPLTERNLARYDRMNGGSRGCSGPDDSWGRVMGWGGTYR
jgi:hypothetical protein